MSNIAISLTVGVLTGVLANIFTNIFINVGLPTYRDYVYKGVRVDGDWILSQGDNPIDGEDLKDLWNVSISLEQKENRISGSGTAQRHKNDTGKDIVDIVHYNVEGYIYDRFVFIYLRPNENNRIANSSLHLEVVGDGSKMKGYRTFYGLLMNEIRAVDVVLSRKSARHALSQSEKSNDMLDGEADEIQ